MHPGQIEYLRDPLKISPDNFNSALRSMTNNKSNSNNMPENSCCKTGIIVVFRKINLLICPISDIQYRNRTMAIRDLITSIFNQLDRFFYRKSGLLVSKFVTRLTTFAEAIEVPSINCNMPAKDIFKALHNLGAIIF